VTKTDKTEEGGPQTPPELLAAVLDSGGVGVLVVDQQRRVVIWNRWLASASGISSSDILGRPLQDAVPGMGDSSLYQGVIGALERGESALLSSDQSPFQLYARGDKGGKDALPHLFLIKPVDTPLRHCLVEVLDIRPVLEQHHTWELHTQAILSSIADAVITTELKGRITYMNSVAEELTGWRLEQAKDRSLEEVFNVVDENSRIPVIEPVYRCLKNGEVVIGDEHELVLLHRDGIGIAIEESFAPIRDEKSEVQGVVVVFRDVSHARRLAAQISWQASHDPLTGLVNRSTFDQRLEALIEAARQEKQEHCLLYMDLDQFKIVNDTCGHVAGDELLRQVASVLSGHIRESDTLARLGGDEFGVLLVACPDEKALFIANQIRDAINEFRFGWGGKSFTIGVSIGLVVVNAQSERMEMVMSAADTACYAAKDGGRNQIRVFQPNASEAALRQGEMQWVSRIQSALDEDRFVLYGQNIAPVRHKGEDIHFEVLIRMLDEEGNLVPPGAFIPAAERFNLMQAIDRWVIHKIFSLIERHRDLLAKKRVLFSINLSGGTVSDEASLEFIGNELVRLNIPEKMICFEITETAAISNLSSANYFMRTLKQAGCSFSLDDFGSGLSSFAYLKNLPVDFLKIDGAFVRDLADDPIDRAMVEAINQIGHVMNLETIAEFVETGAVLDQLRAIGVDYAQGYGISAPQPLLDDEGELILNGE
jgi:Amt family ammonium transporter